MCECFGAQCVELRDAGGCFVSVVQVLASLLKFAPKRHL